MAKYIDVEKVFCADCEDRDRCGSPDVFCDVHSMPAADVAPVVHGEWVDDQYFWRCSMCLEWLEVSQGTADMNYCPHCGAKMDGERKNNNVEN